MNAENCRAHSQYIDVEGPDGIYYPWLCECPESDDQSVDFLSAAGYDGSGMVQCRDCTVIMPLYGFMRTPQDMGECPMCGGPVDNV